MEITIYRDPPLACEPRRLPASVYNLAHVLRARSASGVVFIPIRSMQILAILDAEEFVFLDGHTRSWALIGWQRFRPGERTQLDEPVPFEVCHYHPDGPQLMRQLQVEFHKALQAYAAKERIECPAKVLKFQRPASSQD